MSRGFIFSILLTLLIGFPLINQTANSASFQVPSIKYDPLHYYCYQANEKLTIDGNLDEKSWEQSIWTNNFVDIEGDSKPTPTYKTHVKMLWDKDYFYIGAELEEPHIWAKLTERDAIIFYDNDFEVFIDPNADTHEYYELEINAFNTVWDLFIVKPYRDGGPAIHSWDIQGLKTAVQINGTLNDPNDLDSSWTVEIAIPWVVIKESAHKDTPPKDNDVWKVNFSRVQWQTEVVDNEYIKSTDSLGNILPENNWVWSPQGLINMHYPEMWGYVQFVDHPVELWQQHNDSALPLKDSIKISTGEINPISYWTMRKLYYMQRNYKMLNGNYAASFNQFEEADSILTRVNSQLQIFTTPSMFEIIYFDSTANVDIHITQDGRIWYEKGRKNNQ